MVIVIFYKNNKRPSHKSHGLNPINKHSNTNSQFTSNRYNVFNNAIFIKSNVDFKKICTNTKLYCDTDGFPYNNSISKVKFQ